MPSSAPRPPSSRPDESQRLRSVLLQLPVGGLCPSVLDVGCGSFFSELTIRNARPDWTLFGLDIDGPALRQVRCRAPWLRLVQADAVCLPGLLRTRFGLILVRHPDLFRHRAAWAGIIPHLPALLAPGGFLLLTLYALEEVDLVRAFYLPPAYPLDETALSPVSLAGFDRFLLAYRAEVAS
jgi:SAM-dependent methyltransferase